MRVRQNVKGIKDLMGQLTQSELAKELIDREASGNWYSHMNVSNLIHGVTIPRNPSVLLVLADIFEVSIEEMINRYSYEEGNSSKV